MRRIAIKKRMRLFRGMKQPHGKFFMKINYGIIRYQGRKTALSQFVADGLGNAFHPLGVGIVNLVFEIHVTLLLHGHQVDMSVRHFQSQDCYSDFATRDSLFQCFGYLLGEQHHPGKLVVVNIEDIVGLMFGNDQRVSPIYRIDVEEGKVMVVLGDFITGYFSGYYS